MRAPHFVQLARMDDHRFISACRHGLVHLTWGRVTLRFRREEFRQMADLLSQVQRHHPPITRRVGALIVTRQFGGDWELRVGPMALHLDSETGEAFIPIAQEAVRQLDEVLASGMWDQEPEKAPASLEEQLHIPFSSN
ncbi:MAG TPA: hypothetical protein ENJ31_13785 [Anaerolineae bacterium]|nr:hypothetical protein [Anaerolineae bacterium]